MLYDGVHLPDGFQPITQNSPIPDKAVEHYSEDGPFDLFIDGKIVRGYWGSVGTRGGGRAWGWLTTAGMRDYYTPAGWRQRPVTPSNPPPTPKAAIAGET